MSTRDYAAEIRMALLSMPYETPADVMGTTWTRTGEEGWQMRNLSRIVGTDRAVAVTLVFARLHSADLARAPRSLATDIEHRLASETP